MRSSFGLLIVMGLVGYGMIFSSDATVFGQTPRTVKVNVLTYGKSGGESIGVCSPVYVRAEESLGGEVRVGFFESEVGGTGNQWRSAGWMAAVTAAMLSDFDPRATRVSFEFEGRIDGPSAGALLTCGVLAVARGDTLRDDVAMTGTINPDGSIGPVGGILHKIGGASQKGMNVVLIPAGIRFDTNDAGERVDLLEYGDRLGVKVVNVFDIYHAYKLLSGKDLPRPPAAYTPQITLKAQQQISSKLDVWYERYEKSLQSFLKLQNTAARSDEVVALYQQGVDAIKHSQELINEGEFTAAWWDRVLAAACGYLALETGRCRYTYSTSGYEGLVKRLRDNSWLEKEAQAIAARLRDETPQSLDQLSLYLIACEAFIEATSLQYLAQLALGAAPEHESEEGLEWVGDAAQNQIFAWLDLKLAGDYLDMVEGYAGREIPADASWRQAGNFLRRASSANLAVFDSVIVEPAAKQMSVSVSDVHFRLMLRDRDFAVVRAAETYVIPHLQRYLGDGDALGYGILASSMFTHTRIAGLLAKYYSLDAELNDAGYVVGLKRERTLAEWLTYAEDQTRRNVAVLQENGIDASPCAQMYGIARIKARRDVMQQMEGLVGFWATDLHARVLQLVANVSQSTPATALEEEPQEESPSQDNADVDVSEVNNSPTPEESVPASPGE